MNLLRNLYKRLPWVRARRARKIIARVNWQQPERVVFFGSERGSLSLRRAA